MSNRNCLVVFFMLIELWLVFSFFIRTFAISASVSCVGRLASIFFIFWINESAFSNLRKVFFNSSFSVNRSDSCFRCHVAILTGNALEMTCMLISSTAKLFPPSIRLVNALFMGSSLFRNWCMLMSSSFFFLSSNWLDFMHFVSIMFLRHGYDTPIVRFLCS